MMAVPGSNILASLKKHVHSTVYASTMEVAGAIEWACIWSSGKTVEELGILDQLMKAQMWMLHTRNVHSHLTESLLVEDAVYLQPRTVTPSVNHTVQSSHLVLRAENYCTAHFGN